MSRAPRREPLQSGATLQRLTLESFRTREEAFTAAVAQTCGVGRFCSGPDWLLPAHRWLQGPRWPYILEADGHWLALAVGTFGGSLRLAQPLEAAWCFGTPLVGPDPQQQLALLQVAIRDLRGRCDGILLGGIPTGSPFDFLLQTRLRRRLRVQGFPGSDTLLADLGEGPRAWFRRRPAKLRATLRRARRRAREAGVTCEAMPTGSFDAVLPRILRIEEQGWKAAAGESIFAMPDHRNFYADVLARVAARGALRGFFARQGGADIAYIAGVRTGDTYRGLQMSYVESAAPLSPGHLVHARLLVALAAEGVKTVDLGMVIPYKRVWADRTLPLTNYLISL